MQTNKKKKTYNLYLPPLAMRVMLAKICMLWILNLKITFYNDIYYYYMRIVNRFNSDAPFHILVQTVFV